METTISILIIALILIISLIFCILYIRILKKENKWLSQELDDCDELVTELDKELSLQKDLAKTFEEGYDNLKAKSN